MGSLRISEILYLARERELVSAGACADRHSSGARQLSRRLEQRRDSADGIVVYLNSPVVRWIAGEIRPSLCSDFERLRESCLGILSCVSLGWQAVRGNVPNARRAWFNVPDGFYLGAACEH